MNTIEELEPDVPGERVVRLKVGIRQFVGLRHECSTSAIGLLTGQCSEKSENSFIKFPSCLSVAITCGFFLEILSEISLQCIIVLGRVRSTVQIFDQSFRDPPGQPLCTKYNSRTSAS